MFRLNHCLRGVRVLDLSSYLPGPFASQVLADFGAQVVKIEPPQGDGMRLLGPRDADGTPAFHAALNAGKTICRLDLKSDAGRRRLDALLVEADVLIEGFRPGVMGRLGLGWNDLCAVHPRLIYCSLSGYGLAGPAEQRAGHDANYLAMAGVLHRNGRPPRFFDPPIADMTSGLYAVIAILGALEARRRDGRGCHIDLGIADVAMPLQSFQIAALGCTGSPQPETTYLNGGAAYYRVYGTKDGRHVVLGAVERKFWQAFCRAAQRPDWVARHGEPIPQTELMGEIGRFFADLTAAECDARFAAEDCCVTLVLDLAEAVATPHHRERGIVRRDGQGHTQVLFPARVDGEAPTPRQDLTETGEARWACETSPA
ncbi:CaiB/BaiF CoA transferase family protein [Rhodopila sp.]|uniref:CaiB/BaiF CoA transferase family protein n=1 Tax=Rhodopila sp. TaxID=2480087 RepID=UPI002C9CAF63|nr:CoA transferase [Rhodopila sp.]HVZ08923.1 CoA transferase [Rhodopila sp.]